MILFHAANKFETRNERDRERYGRAEKTWWQLYQGSDGMIREAHSTAVHYKRTAKSIGDQRDCPFIKDVIGVALRKAGPDDAIMLTNFDSQIVSDAGDWLFEKLVNNGCCWSGRRDMYKIHRTWLCQKDIMERGEPFAGVDLVAFTVKWWTENQESYPDLLLGYEGWDWCFKFQMGEMAEMPPLIYHETHQEPYWHRHRKMAIGQIHNRRLCNEWAKARPDYEKLRAVWQSLDGYNDPVPAAARRYAKGSIEDYKKV